MLPAKGFHFPQLATVVGGHLWRFAQSVGGNDVDQQRTNPLLFGQDSGLQRDCAYKTGILAATVGWSDRMAIAHQLENGLYCAVQHFFNGQCRLSAGRCFFE